MLKPTRPEKTDLTESACIVGYFGITILFFYSRALTSFFYAGYVSQNLHYYRDTFGLAGARGLLPYVNTPVEYPPLGAAWLWAMAPFAGTQELYAGAFTTGMMLVSILGLLGVLRLAALAAPGVNPARRAAAATAAYTIAIIAAGPVGLVSLDYLPMTLTVWSLTALLNERPARALALLAAGVAAKGYPLVLLPLFLYESYKRHGRAGLIRAAVSFIAATAFFFGIPALIAPRGVAASFTFHAGRGVEKSSVYGAALYALRLAGLKFPAAADEICWPMGLSRATDLAAHASSWALLAILAAAHLWLLRAERHAPTAVDEPAGESALRITARTALILTAALIGFKVSSPQFLAWPLPFIAALSFGRRGVERLVFFAAAGIAAQWIFPWHLGALNHGARLAPIFALWLKWLLLIAVFADLAAVVNRKTASDVVR